MYESKKSREKKDLVSLKKYFFEFLDKRNFVFCKVLNNRKVFFDKLPEAIIKRRDCKKRLQCFWVALDIVKNSRSLNHRIYKGKNEYEIQGFSVEGEKVYVHIREESQKKDKKLFLISTYYFKK